MEKVFSGNIQVYFRSILSHFSAGAFSVQLFHRKNTPVKNRVITWDFDLTNIYNYPSGSITETGFLSYYKDTTFFSIFQIFLQLFFITSSKTLC